MAQDIKLIGFNLTKISAIKNPNFKGALDIKSNVNIKGIDKHRLELSKQDAIKIDFAFNIDYKELGSISLEGTMFVLPDLKTLKQILSEWKDKKINSEINVALMNIILQKVSLKAFQIEEELGLPIHIQLPHIQLKKE